MNDWFDAERYAEQARHHYDAGQWRDALSKLRRALKVNPDQPDWQFGLGLTLDAMGRYEEAVSAYQRVLDLRGEDEELLLHLSVDLLRTGAPRRALEMLDRAAERNPACEPAYCYRVKAYAMLDQHDRAEEMFYLARQLVEECPRCYGHMAESLDQRGQTARAIWCWQQTLRLDPQYPDVRANLARAHWHSGNLERAHRLFIRQLRLTPGDIGTLMHVGFLLIEMRRDAEAAEKLRRVLEIDPTIGEAHAALGELALRNGHVEAAARHFRRAQRLGPDRPGANLGLARAAHRMDKPDQARRFLLAEMAVSGQTVGQVLEMARLLIELDLPEKALELLLPLDEPLSLRSDEQVAAALLYRGVARMLLGQLEAGIRDCRRCCRVDPGNVVVLHNIILAYLELGDLTRARVFLRKFVRTRPNDPQCRVLQLRCRRQRLASAWRRLRGFFKAGN